MSPNRQKVLGAAIAVAAAGGLLAVRVGLNRGLLFAVAGTALLASIALYFDTRNRDAPPSRTERSLAFAWLAFRRIVGFGAALLVLLGMTLAVQKAPLTPGLVAGLVVALLFAGFFAWVGWYGQGPRRHEFKDDVRQHAENKRRYRW